MPVTPFSKYSQLMETRGIVANRNKLLPVQFTGDDWYGLLSFLESAAENSKDISQIRPLVAWSTQIRLQLKGSGF